MKTFLNNLLEATSKAASIVEPRPAFLAHSLLKLVASEGCLTVAASSEYQAIEARIPCDGDLPTTLVDCKLFHSLLSRIWGEEISLSVNGQQLVVQAEFGEARLATAEVESFVSLPWLEGQQEIDLPSLRDCDKEILFSVADPSKPILNGVHCLFADKQLRLTASDGYRLTIKTLDMDTPFQASFVVRPDAAKQIFSLSPGKLKADNSLVQIENENTKFVTRVVEGQYPNIEPLLNQQNNSFCVFQREDMIQAIKAAMVFLTRPRIRMVFDRQITILSDDQEESRGRCKLQVSYKELVGDAPAFYCNPRFFLDWLRSVPGEEVRMEWSAPNKAVFLRQNSNIGLIMPMAVR